MGKTSQLNSRLKKHVAKDFEQSMLTVTSHLNRLLNGTCQLLVAKPSYVRCLFSRSKKEEGETASSAPTNEEHKQDQQLESSKEELPVVTALKSKNEKLEHQLRYAVAELKNLQNRIKQQVDEAHNFGASKFIKDMFVVADTIETVINKTPKDSINVKSSPVDSTEECKKLTSLLKDLLIGVEMTQSMLQKTFNAHKVIKCTPLGEDFDPNFHMAKYEIPKDATKYAPGKIGEVVRAGYTFNGRVLRAAEVGVVKK